MRYSKVTPDRPAELSVEPSNPGLFRNPNNNGSNPAVGATLMPWLRERAFQSWVKWMDGWTDRAMRVYAVAQRHASWHSFFGHAIA